MPGSPLFYDVYDVLYGAKDYAGEVRSAVSLALGEILDGRILEIGAGTGNHSLACAGLGMHVTAVEIDASMVELMRGKLNKAPAALRERVKCFHGRVEDLPASGYDMAMAMFNVVNYLPTLAALRSFMEGVSGRVKPGGGFVFDAWNGVAALRDPPGTTRRRAETAEGTVDVRITAKTDLMGMKTELQYEIERVSDQGARKERGTFTFPQTLWHPAVLAEEAVNAGFAMVAIHPLGDLSREATSEDWKILFHLCKKSPLSPTPG